MELCRRTVLTIRVNDWMVGPWCCTTTDKSTVLKNERDLLNFAVFGKLLTVLQYLDSLLGHAKPRFGKGPCVPSRNDFPKQPPLVGDWRCIATGMCTTSLSLNLKLHCPLYCRMRVLPLNSGLLGRRSVWRPIRNCRNSWPKRRRNVRLWAEVQPTKSHHVLTTF